MARTKSGGFNKFLNFIGLVDDAEPSYENEYASENYGRASTYVPQRQRANARPTQSAPAPRRSSAPSRSTRTSGDDRGYSERSYSASSRYSDRYDDRSARADDGYADEPRPARRAAYDDGYAAEASRTSRTERPRSRFEEEPARRVERTEAPVPVQRTRISRPQRTVMFSVLPGTPGSRQQMPRMTRSTLTPAQLASESLSMTSRSVSEFILKHR